MTWQTAISQPSELGESPFWHPDEQRLYWVDITACQICRADAATGMVERWTVPSEPGCIAPARTGGQNSGLVMALRDGIYRARQWGGELALLAPAQHDPATLRFNDGKADALGRFWAGTIYEPRGAARAQLFSLDGRGGRAPVLEAKAADATTANGLAWSPDAATLYWADTPRHLVRAWDWDAAGNTLSHERVFRQWPVKPEGWQAGMPGYGGRPDGAAVDSQGNYYVAMYEGARLLKLSPAGELLAEFAVPAQCPTMPCFGGADLKTLYLTTARHGRPAAELQAWPDSGCIFSMRVDVPGLPVNFFRD
ncbi:SMP-30/gluconolactonase/LRE family protein [Polaromonas naphthalenivorans]|uniref:Gluconolactonase n=1 Tax=Polaromonas naphthalenivorans (strain CJ2) TaxID=365044 RepID=A1VIG9_POLNA|nr:SMP-30/gluconolactonase/LRE family protein [Polaromonas naphthalenivorans]ABM35447.1 gluconolactonase [Polaromonas naphthalenivorans CJ2]